MDVNHQGTVWNEMAELRRAVLVWRERGWMCNMVRKEGIP